MKKHRLQPNQLKKRYVTDDLSEPSYQVPRHQKAVIGQERAIRALKFGLGNRAPGFNVYVSTPHGEEKITIIQRFLEELVKGEHLPYDWCYLNNFKDNYCPVALRLPQGLASVFKSDLENFILEAKRSLLRTFDSEEYNRQQSEIKQELVVKQQEIFTSIQEEADRRKFVVKTSPMEIVAIPLVNGKPMSQKQFQNLSPEEREKIQEKQDEFQQLLESTIRKSRELEKEANRQLVKLERKAALFAINDLIDDIETKYRDIEGVAAILEDMKQHILDNLVEFLKNIQVDRKIGMTFPASSIEHLYQVNILVDNAGLDHPPIIVELNPTYNNLFGKIEHESVMGTLVTDFTLIRAGALHRANGGYLIIPVDDLLRAPFSYDTLKRSLRNNQIEIEDPSERYGFLSSKSLKPQPVPLNVQVILVGRDYLMQLLYVYDEDFKDLFKVKADFDSVMPATKSNLKDLCGYISSFCQEESLLQLDAEAIAKTLEYGHRLARDQEKISTQIEEITDLIREAHYYATEEESPNITARHIEKTIFEKEYRSNLLYEKVKELINNKTIIIDLKGSKVGQINGLSVIESGDNRFGRPSRITAIASVGGEGVLDIEREVEMGGPIHSKGVLILSGYLYEKFGRDKPLSVSVRTVFEQSYSGVEGDSASSAELYAILSSLSEVPLKQYIAVTGSVNQKGEIQAVGGINEKIEGYFEVCRQAGLTGEQGVLIPQANVRNLMLKDEVVDAVEKNQFHIWAVRTVEEGVEILTGHKAGTTSWDKTRGILEFEKDSVYDLVNRRLWQMSLILKEFARTDQKDA